MAKFISSQDGEITITGNLTVSENLTVSGTTTTLDVENILVEDPKIVLAKDNETDTLDLGIIGIRDTINVAVFWDESEDEFAFVTTVDDGSTADPIAITDYANLRVNELTCNTLNLAIGSTFGNITVGVTDSNTIDTTSGDLVLDAFTGLVQVTLDLDVTNDLTVGNDVDIANDLEVGNNLDVLGVTTLNTELDGYLFATAGVVSSVEAPLQSLIIAASDETTVLTEGTDKVTFRMPYEFNLVSVRASLTTEQTSGDIVTVDINHNGSTIFSTLLTIDNTEKTSVTALTAAALSTTTLSNDSEITVDIPQLGDGTATGLKVTLIGRPA